jgi:hypothetical protein
MSLDKFVSFCKFKMLFLYEAIIHRNMIIYDLESTKQTSTLNDICLTTFNFKNIKGLRPTFTKIVRTCLKKLSIFQCLPVNIKNTIIWL